MKDLRKQNIILLVKWWWKLDTGEGLWQDVVRAKYFKRDTVATVEEKFSDTPIWKAIVKVKEHYMPSRKIILNYGNVARLRFDRSTPQSILNRCTPQLSRN